MSVFVFFYCANHTAVETQTHCLNLQSKSDEQNAVPGIRSVTGDLLYMTTNVFNTGTAISILFCHL